MNLSRFQIVRHRIAEAIRWVADRVDGKRNLDHADGCRYLEVDFYTGKPWDASSSEFDYSEQE